MRAFLYLLTILVCCDGAAAEEKPPLLIYAAASLTDVLPQIGEAWEQKHGTPIVFSFDASSRLARQIVHGAPADVFISADEVWMNHLHSRHKILSDTRADMAGNELVVIGTGAGKKSNRSAQTLNWVSYSKIAMAGEHVPAGRYGQDALTHLGLWETLQAKLVRGAHVRTVVAWVEQGLAPVGVAYRSDAIAREGRVHIVGVFPENSHGPIRYPGAVIKASANKQRAQAFLNFCRSPQAQKIFQNSGFRALSPL